MSTELTDNAGLEKAYNKLIWNNRQHFC